MVTESTRNGMSSVTTSTTEWPAADQPRVGEAGGDDPDRGGALRPRLREPVVGGEGAVQVLGTALDEVLGGDVAVVGRQQVLDLVVVGSAGALASDAPRRRRG